MKLTDLLIPLKALDEKVHEDYNRIGMKLDQRGISRAGVGALIESISMVYICTSGTVSHSTYIPSGDLDTLAAVGLGGAISDIYALDFVHSVRGLFKDKFSVGGEIAADYIDQRLTKFGRLVRLPMLGLSLVSYVSAAYSVATHFALGSDITTENIGLAAITFGIASSIYLKDTEPAGKARAKLHSFILSLGKSLSYASPGVYNHAAFHDAQQTD